MTPRILAGIPTLRGAPSRVQNSIRTQEFGGTLTLLEEECSPLHVARGRLVKTAYENGYTHFWSLDDDVMPRGDCLAKLLETDKPIVAGVYMLRKKVEMIDGTKRYVPSFGGLAYEPGAGEARLSTTAGYPGAGLATVGWVGLGCALIRLADVPGITSRSFRPVLTDDDSIAFAMWCVQSGFVQHVRFDAEAEHIHKIPLQPRANYFGHLAWSDEVLKRHGECVVTTERDGTPRGFELVLRRLPV